MNEFEQDDPHAELKAQYVRDVESCKTIDDLNAFDLWQMRNKTGNQSWGYIPGNIDWTADEYRRHPHADTIIAYHKCSERDITINCKESAELPFDIERAKAGDVVEILIGDEWETCIIFEFDSESFSATIENHWTCGSMVNDVDKLRMKYPPRTKIAGND